METIVLPQKKRYLSIDVFRGLTIVVMVFVNTTGDFSGIPAWSHHATDYGLTYVDLVAPFFIFAIALTYHSSYVSGQLKEGFLQNNLRVLRRYFALAGMGFLAWAAIDMVDQKTFHPQYSWNVFQAIGMAGLVTLLFINLPRWWRLLAALVLAAGYQCLIATRHIDDINFAEVHSGFWGGIGYGIMMLLATVVCEAFENNRMRDFLIAGAVFTLAGVVMAYFWGIGKNRLTTSYIFICPGLGCLVFYVFWLLYDKRKITFGTRVFQPIGKNPLFLYILHGPLTALPLLFMREDAFWLWPTLFGLLNMLIIWLAALWLDKRRIYLSI